MQFSPCLYVLRRPERPELFPVVLPYVVEDDRPGWHVDAHGEGLRGEEQLDEVPSEQHLHHLLQNGEDAGVVDADAPLKELGQLQNLKFPKYNVEIK